MRRVCEEVKLNLAYRWFCGLNLEDKVPDHSTFSKNEHGRFREAEALRYVFEQVLERCMNEGLVGGEGFAVDASRQRHCEDDDDDWGGGRGRPVREYLEALDEGQTFGGNASRKVSVTDPGLSWTAAPGGPAFYGYSTNYLVDTGHGVIVDVESTTADRGKEVESTRVMLDRVESRFDLKPARLIGDTAYGTALMLGWLVEEKGIEPHVPVWEKGERKDGTFSRSDFTFDAAADQYTCPNGKPLVRYQRAFTKPRSGIHKDQTIRYHARTKDCRACAFKEQCCPNTPRRKVNRSIHESAREVARTAARTED